MARRFSREVDSAIAMAAERYRMSPDTLRAIARVESSGNPRAQTGSYSGLFQLSNREFQRGGGRGDIYDPVANSMAAASNFRAHQQQFESTYQRPPSPAELYMIHQQGWGGFQAHMNNPDRPAWENMASTAEGRARGEGWARQAIRGNTLPDARRHGDMITSRQFMDSWTARISREPGLTVDTTATAAPAAAPTTGPVDPEAMAFANPPGPINQDEATAYADRPDMPGTSPVTPEMVASTTAPPIVQGVDPLSGGAGKGGATLGGIFGNIGKGLAAAGKAMASTKISVPSFPDPEAQVAALEREGQQPVSIPARKPRKFPGKQGPFA